MRAAQIHDAAPEIAVPDDPALRLDSCRRLLGPNLFGPSTGAVGDALTPGLDHALVLDRWQAEAAALVASLGWAGTRSASRLFQGGASLFVPAPADRLFTAAYLVEAAWALAAFALLGRAGGPDRDGLAAGLRTLAAHEANPRLVALIDQAAGRGLDRMLDDDAVSFGHGKGAVTWDNDALPDPPDWRGLHDIPLALVTGTNGKTTTTRLIAAMAEAAGKVAGLSSTDGVRVGRDYLERGDFSGPQGARMLLSDRRLDVGVLEVARGGILRRGLPVTRARAAVVTNVAADHLGQYGIMTVPELARVKLAIHLGLAPGGLLILNADDPPLVAAARALDCPIAWFALDPGHPLICAARDAAQPCAFVEAGRIVLSDGHVATPLIAVGDVPLTLGGAARYNIENALGAALAARALGLPDAAIRAALAAFRSDVRDNPGRANEFSVKGARVFVDFAHNPHSIAAVTSALAAVPARRRFLMLSHAGDRSDEDIAGLVEGAFALHPDVVVAAEMEHYLRGRVLGEVPGLIAARCRALGGDGVTVSLAPSPAAGAQSIIAALQPGDLALLLVHDERDRIVAMLGAAEG